MAPTLDPDQIEQLRMVAGGDQAWLVELFEIYIADARQNMHRLVEVATGSDGTEISNAAHKLKGASANVGARILSERCEEVMRAGRLGDLRAVPELVHSVQDEWIRVERAMQDLVRSPA